MKVGAAGTYFLYTRYSNAASQGTVAFTVGTKNLGSRSLAPTGHWDTWATVSQLVGFNVGQQTLRLTATKGGFKLNWISISSTTPVESNIELPGITRIEQNYPNPFNPNTFIEYSVSEESPIKIVVFDVLGREIKTLVNEVKKAGRYRVEFDASSLPGGISAKGGYSSGVYFYQLQTKQLVQTKKLLLMK